MISSFAILVALTVGLFGPAAVPDCLGATFAVITWEFAQIAVFLILCL